MPILFAAAGELATALPLPALLAARSSLLCAACPVPHPPCPSFTLPMAPRLPTHLHLPFGP